MIKIKSTFNVIPMRNGVLCLIWIAQKRKEQTQDNGDDEANIVQDDSN